MAGVLALTLAERLFLANQYRILEALYPNDAVRFALNRLVIEGGFTSQYGSLLADLKPDLPLDDCRLVADVLDLYRVLQGSVRQLRDRDGVNAQDIELPGFDGETEGPMQDLAQHLIKSSDRPSTFQHAYADSRTPMAARYRRMIAVWAGLERRASLTKQEIQAILAA